MAAMASAAPAVNPAVGRDASMLMTRTPPDPPALVARDQWVIDLRWDRGEVFLLGTHRLTPIAPRATPRAMGRFAVELYEGPTLIERVRFDFPLLGAPDIETGKDPLAPKLRTRIGVVFPATARGTALQLWDRATGERWALPWPFLATDADGSSNADAQKD